MTGTARPFDLLVVGDASVDTYTRVPFFPGADQKAMGTMLGVHGGGMGTNFAAAASNVGVRTRLVTSVGSDAAGQAFLREVAEHGVDASASVITEGITFACFIQLDATGEKSLIGSDTGIKLPPAGVVTPELVGDARYLYVLADDIAWASRVARVAVAAGTRVVIDLERSGVSGDLDACLELVSIADIVCTNTQALVDVGPVEAEEIARMLTARGPRIVLVTDGARGSLALAGGRFWRSVPPAVPVVDTTGAGDAHNGAFVGRVIQGATVPEAMRTATAVAALCVRHIGSRTYRSALTADHLRGTGITVTGPVPSGEDEHVQPRKEKT